MCVCARQCFLNSMLHVSFIFCFGFNCFSIVVFFKYQLHFFIFILFLLIDLCILKSLCEFYIVATVVLFTLHNALFVCVNVCGGMVVRSLQNNQIVSVDGLGAGLATNTVLATLELVGEYACPCLPQI